MSALRSSRRPARLALGLATTALAVGTVAAAPPAAAAPYCGITWGSTPESVDAGTSAPLVGVRAGRHACFDRLVLDVAGRPAAGFWASYVPQVTADGSGDVVPTRGGAALQVVARTPAYDATGRATYDPADDRELVPVAGYRTFRQVVWAGSFEGSSTVGIGVRARLPFRVFALDGPGGRTRLVVDVAHRW